MIVAIFAQKAKKAFNFLVSVSYQAAANLSLLSEKWGKQVEI